MLQIRPFCNIDPLQAAIIWNEKTKKYPNIYCPVTSDLLSAHVFGNVLFDREGFFIAFDNGRPIGFIHAYFPPSHSWDEYDTFHGIIFPPIIISSLSQDEHIHVAEELIKLAEKYLKDHGSKLFFAGGCSLLPAFYSGLYGRDIAYGLLEEQNSQLAPFVNLGYRVDKKFRRFQLYTNEYTAPSTMRIREARRAYKVLENRPSKARNWWYDNVFRNFRTMEWNVFPIKETNTSENTVAGTVLQIMETFFSNPIVIIAELGVDECYDRQGIGSILLSDVIFELKKTYYQKPPIISMTTPEGDERMTAFLHKHQFLEVAPLHTLVKENK